MIRDYLLADVCFNHSKIQTEVIRYLLRKYYKVGTSYLISTRLHVKLTDSRHSSYL
jgi:hypothetical protein